MKKSFLQTLICLLGVLVLTGCNADKDMAFLPEASNDTALAVISEQNETEAEASEYALTVKGSGVKEERSFTISEMKEMPDAVFKAEFFALNNYGTKDYFEFEGVKVKSLLNAAGLNENAQSVTFVAEDGYENTLSVEEALKEDYIDEQNPQAKYPVILAWEENGEVYDGSNGAPFRLVLGQKEAGDVNKPGWVMNVAEIVVE